MLHTIVIATEPNGDAEETLHERMKAYVGASDTLSVLVGGDTSARVVHTQKDYVIRVVDTKRFRPLHIWRIVRDMRALLAERGFKKKEDHIMLVAEGIANARMTEQIAQRLRAPFELVYDGEGGCVSTDVPRVWERVAGVRVSSRRMRDSVAPMCLPHREPCILPFPHERVLGNERHPDARTILGYASDVSSCETLLVAWKHIVNRYPDMRLAISYDVREGEEGLMRPLSLAHRLGVASSVEDVSFSDTEAIRRYAEKAMLFLHVPSALPFGIRLLDVYMAGVPIVTVHTGIVGELLTGDDVLICPVGDAGCIAKQALFYIDNAPVRESLGKTARRVTYSNRESFARALRSRWEAIG